MTTRYTRKALVSLVDYANETLPPIEGYKFHPYGDAFGNAVRLKKVDTGGERELYCGRYTPRIAAEKFITWLFSSTCPREYAFDVYDYAYNQGIRL